MKPLNDHIRESKLGNIFRRVAGKVTDAVQYDIWDCVPKRYRLSIFTDWPCLIKEDVLDSFAFNKNKKYLQTISDIFGPIMWINDKYTTVDSEKEVCKRFKEWIDTLVTPLGRDAINKFGLEFTVLSNPQWNNNILYAKLCGHQIVNINVQMRHAGPVGPSELRLSEGILDDEFSDDFDSNLTYNIWEILPARADMVVSSRNYGVFMDDRNNRIDYFDKKWVDVNNAREGVANILGEIVNAGKGEYVAMSDRDQIEQRFLNWLESLATPIGKYILQRGNNIGFVFHMCQYNDVPGARNPYIKILLNNSELVSIAFTDKFMRNPRRIQGV